MTWHPACREGLACGRATVWPAPARGPLATFGSCFIMALYSTKICICVNGKSENFFFSGGFFKLNLQWQSRHQIFFLPQNDFPRSFFDSVILTGKKANLSEFVLFFSVSNLFLEVTHRKFLLRSSCVSRKIWNKKAKLNSYLLSEIMVFRATRVSVSAACHLVLLGTHASWPRAGLSLVSPHQGCHLALRSLAAGGRCHISYVFIPSFLEKQTQCPVTYFCLLSSSLAKVLIGK